MTPTLDILTDLLTAIRALQNEIAHHLKECNDTNTALKNLRSDIDHITDRLDSATLEI